MRTLLAVILIVAGVLAVAFGLIIWVSIPASDTSTGSLISFGATFAVPGLIAILAGGYVLRRRST